MTEKTTILVVDDDAALSGAVAMILEMADYDVVTADSGEDALCVLQRSAVDAIVADIAMPGMNGYQLFRRVSETPEWSRIPFIFLSGRDMDSDIRFGKELGVDDYLTKPVFGPDLLAAVRGRLRRAQVWTNPREQSAGHAPTRAVIHSAESVIEFGRLRIDTLGHRVWVEDEPIQLSAREFRLLVKLATNHHTLLSPRVLVNATHLLDTDSADASNLLRPLVRSLRRKLGYGVGEMGCIENVRGVGYRLLPL